MADHRPSSLDALIRLLARLPGLGPRSAQRAALYLLKHRDSVMAPLADALGEALEGVTACSICGLLDGVDPCSICRDERRDPSVICVVEDVSDVWALERAKVFAGRYHVLGGVLSALDGAGPEDLRIGTLMARAREDAVREVVLALGATVDGAATAHYLAEQLKTAGVAVSSIARGVPVGGELTYLDEGTLSAALASRRPA